MDTQLQSYTFGRLVALVAASLDNLPEGFEAKCIRQPRGYFATWFKRACLNEGEHQRMMMEIVDSLDPEWVFPAGLPQSEQTKAWEGYYKQRSTDSRAQFGKMVAELRTKRGLTIYELASLSGLHHTNISKIENGKYNVSLDLLTKLMNALNGEIKLSEN